jgi:RNA polymerase sigma-70 factor (ECF subfamily)
MGGVRILEWLAPAVPVEKVDWESVYREEMPRVFSYFRYRGLERATAEDLTSATFEKAWRARDRYRRDRAAVSTWLLAIARNVAIDHFRAAPEVPLGRRAAAGTTEADALRLSASARRCSRPVDRGASSWRSGLAPAPLSYHCRLRASAPNMGTILHRAIGTLQSAWDKENSMSDQFLPRLREEPWQGLGLARRLRDR